MMEIDNEKIYTMNTQEMEIQGKKNQEKEHQKEENKEKECKEKEMSKIEMQKKCVFSVFTLLAVVVIAGLFVKGLTYGLKHIEVAKENMVSADTAQDGRSRDIDQEYSTKQTDQKEEILKQKAEIKELDMEIMENREDELVFAVSMDDFIDSYNGYYWKDKGTRYLLPSWEWRSYRYDQAIHSRHETGCYHFSADETISPYPTITVYAPTNADYIQEITVNFDDHSYTDQLYKVYEEMCFYTLKVLFADMPDEQIVEQYTTLNKLAFDHITPVKYTSESVPCVLYYRGNIGLYPYFAFGECVHLCVIPVTPQYVEEMRSKGVEIYEI